MIQAYYSGYVEVKGDRKDRACTRIRPAFDASAMVSGVSHPPPRGSRPTRDLATPPPTSARSPIPHPPPIGTPNKTMCEFRERPTKCKWPMDSARPMTKPDRNPPPGLPKNRRRNPTNSHASPAVPTNALFRGTPIGHYAPRIRALDRAAKHDCDRFSDSEDLARSPRGEQPRTIA